MSKEILIYSDYTFDYCNNHQAGSEDYDEYFLEMQSEYFTGGLIELLNHGSMIAKGYVQTWRGKIDNYQIINDFNDFYKCMYGNGNCDVYARVYCNEDGELEFFANHHDGTNYYKVRQLNSEGKKCISKDIDSLKKLENIFERKTLKKPLGKALIKAIGF